MVTTSFLSHTLTFLLTRAFWDRVENIGIYERHELLAMAHSIAYKLSTVIQLLDASHGLQVPTCENGL